MEFWLIVVGVLAVFIIAVVNGNKKQKEISAKLKERGYDESKFINIGSYVGGHPDIDDNIPQCFAYFEHGGFKIYRRETALNMPRFEASINPDSISEITVEDASSIEKKVTLGRVFLVGIFALAWQKKKKNELAFVSIIWSDGRFEHSTLFSFEGKEAMRAANTARNKLIKHITPNPQQQQQQQKPVEKKLTEPEIEKKLDALKRLMDKGLISHDEFEGKKNELLNILK